MTENRFPIRVKWRSSSQGGRLRPHTSDKYHPTASFQDGGPLEAFSFLCRFDVNDGKAASGWGSLLFPDHFPDALERLARGADLILYEGPRATADVTVLVSAAVPV